MGWFGPRGLAPVVFVLMAYEAFHEAGPGSDLLSGTAAWTILLSVVLHGISAVPLANGYACWLETAAPASPELVPVPESGGRRPDPLSWPSIEGRGKGSPKGEQRGHRSVRSSTLVVGRGMNSWSSQILL
jgi:hypothetical protein